MFNRFISTEDPRVEVYVRNWHFRQLTGSCWSLNTEATLQEAWQFVESMPWYYVCEYPDLSAFWFRRAFDWEIEKIPFFNSTGNHEGRTMIVPDVDAATSRQISVKNELDLALYRYAVARFLERSCAASLSQPETVPAAG